jgi:hypothetical protein
VTPRWCAKWCASCARRGSGRVRAGVTPRASCPSGAVASACAVRAFAAAGDVRCGCRCGSTPRAVEQMVLGVSFGGAGESGAPLSGAAAMSDVRNGAALAVSPSQHSA